MLLLGDKSVAPPTKATFTKRFLLVTYNDYYRKKNVPKNTFINFVGDNL